MLILGLDPSLTSTGWGVIMTEGSRLRHIANGQIKTDAKTPMAERLLYIESELTTMMAGYTLDGAAIEEVFVNENPQSTLKLAHARGVILLACARAQLPVAEYAARFVKKAVTGVGNGSKDQVRFMIERLLPGVKVAGPDAADALAVAITHAHHRPR